RAGAFFRRARSGTAVPAPVTPRPPRPGRRRTRQPARPGLRPGPAAAPAVLEPARSPVRPRRSRPAPLVLRDGAARGEPARRPHRLPGRRHARPPVAGAVPAQGRAAGLGRAAPVAAGGRRGLMPLNELHRRVATVALRVATRYGFALGG